MTNQTTQTQPEGRSFEWTVQPFDQSYHASKNPAATKRDTRNPCAICGWAPGMAIHAHRGHGWDHVQHEYVPHNTKITGPQGPVHS